MPGPKDDDDSLALRLRRLVDLTQVRGHSIAGTGQWQSFRAYLSNLPASELQGKATPSDSALGVLVAALHDDPSPTQLEDVAVFLEAPPRYFDMARPRHKVERDLLLAQLCKVGAGGMRLCRGQPTGFELVEILECVLDIACRHSAPPVDAL